jgi:hypothetical protein
MSMLYLSSIGTDWGENEGEDAFGQPNGHSSRLHVTLEGADSPSTMLREPHIRRVEVRHLLVPLLWAGAVAVVWLAMPEGETTICRPTSGHGSLLVIAGAAIAIATYPSLWRSWRILQKLAVSILVGCAIGAALFAVNLGTWIHTCAN